MNNTITFKNALGEDCEVILGEIYNVTHIRRYDNETFTGRAVSCSDKIIRFDRSEKFNSKITNVHMNLLTVINKEG